MLHISKKHNVYQTWLLKFCSVLHVPYSLGGKWIYDGCLGQTKLALRSVNLLTNGKLFVLSENIQMFISCLLAVSNIVHIHNLAIFAEVTEFLIDVCPTCMI